MSRTWSALLGVLLLAVSVLAGAGTAHAATASNGYPYCANGSASDPDGDGWGWENGRSCVVKGSRADTGSSSGGSGGSVSIGSCPNGATCGYYTVSGLGWNKQALTSAGGNVLDMATAMLETEKMDTNYTYGDGKTGDATNFGIFKQNWGMLRVSCNRFKGQSTSQVSNGALLNSSRSADVRCLHDSQSYYGLDRWFAGHRNGSTGLQYPYTTDINNYKAAVYWIRDQIVNNGAYSNDIRFWVNVPAI